MRHPIRRIATQGAWYSLGNALVKVSGLILLPVFTNAHYLPVADYGRWGVFEISAQLAISVLGLSLAVGLVRFYHEPGGGRDALGAAWWITVGMAGLLAVAALVGIPRIAPPSFRTIGWLLVAYTAFEILIAVPLALLRAEGRAGSHTAVLGFKLMLLVLFALFLMVRKGAGLEGMLAAYAGAGGIALVAAILAARQTQFFIPRISGPTARQLLAFSLPLVIGGLGSMVLNAADRYVLAIYRRPEEIAFYTLAEKIGGVVNMFVVQPFNLAWLPLLFRLDEHQRPGVLKLLLPYLNIALCLVVVALSVAVGPTLAIMRSDPAYRRAIALIPWIGFGFVAYGLSAVFSGVLALFHRTRAISLGLACAAVLNMGLNFLLVPSLGAFGAAVNTLIAYAALLAAQFFAVQKILPVRYSWWRVLGVIGTSFAVSLIAVSRSGSSQADWALRIGLPVIWAVILLSTRSFSWREVREAWTVLRDREPEGTDVGPVP